jgi:hypothetical protein
MKAKAQRRAKLPLDDPRWWPWGRAIEQVRQLRLNHAIADQELATAINERDVRCKMEALDPRTDPPKRVVTLLADSFFAVFRIKPGWGKLLAVAQRPDARLPHDHVLYAWGPDLDKIWPTAVPSEAAPKRARRKGKPRKRHADDATALPLPSTPPVPPSPPSPPSTEDKPPTEDKPRTRQGWCRRFADRKWPEGWEGITTPAIMKAAEKDKDFNKNVSPFPGRDTWQRALGRRKG